MSQPSYQVDPQWLETIVKMVVERLREQSSSPQGSTNTDQPSIPAGNTTRIISTRVITLALLRNDMAGVKKLRISKKALVTPAVIDELKDRGIELERCAAVEIDPPTSGPTAHLPAYGQTIQIRREMKESEAAEPRSSQSRRAVRAIHVVTIHAPSCLSAATTLASACQTQSPSTGQSIRELVSMTRERSSPSSLVVIVTCDPLATVWECHQQRIRSATCRSIADTQEAVHHFGASALVIDGRCGLSHELVDAIARLRT